MPNTLQYSPCPTRETQIHHEGGVVLGCRPVCSEWRFRSRTSCPGPRSEFRQRHHPIGAPGRKLRVQHSREPRVCRHQPCGSELGQPCRSDLHRQPYCRSLFVPLNIVDNDYRRHSKLFYICNFFFVLH
ncbi:hypothetical protein L798_05507 [Zootermopsis nevadensis]|uniref:Uncharacterized protein n=1 Tax=Zootermopsis nevadensis TaxID=136037 RepID=A0A067RLB5_ZOONE|nr:hypothetical protein L798_05507 [Zootermopsis nevadensis]